MCLAPAEEFAVDDFAVLLLRTLRHIRRGRVFRTKNVTPLVISSKNRYAKTDVCIVDNQIFLPVQDESLDAIAVFAANHQIRQ